MTLSSRDAVIVQLRVGDVTPFDCDGWVEAVVPLVVAVFVGVEEFVVDNIPRSRERPVSDSFVYLTRPT